jgi:PKD repeat protein
MALNMFIGFMVTRLRAALWAFGVVVCAALAAPSCEKVPLLAPSGSTITLSTATSALGFNGTADVSAQVLEAAGTPPHSGTHVTFSTNLGFVEPAEVQTDVNGRATTRFFAGTSSGVATITATSGGASVAAANAVKIAVGSAAVSAVVASANPSIVSSRGGNSTISAKVTDAGGNALNGIPVTFTTDAGSMSESVSNTNSQGIATSILSTNRTAKVTATAGVSTTTTTPPTGGTGTGTTTTTAPSSSTVTVTVNSTASITIGTPAPATPQVGQTVSFPLTYPASTTGASAIIRVDVDWGDGRRESFNSTPSAISHAYGSAGSFLVVVTGFDALGDTATASQSVTVTPRAQPTVTISATPSNPSVNQTVTFTISATPTTGNAITSMSIDFGDGETRNLPGNATTVQHVYTTSGSKQVTATATDTSGASGSASTVIVVGTTSGPTASFTVNPSSGPITTNFQFDASASTGTGLNYQWNFGDGMFGSGVTTSHTYATTGTKTITLTVTDNQGRTATATRQVTVT